MAKILIHTLVFPPDANSNAYVLADLAHELKKAYGHELTILTTTPHYNFVDNYQRCQPMTPVLGNWLLKSDFDGIPCFHVRVPPVKGDVGTRLRTVFRFHVLGLFAALRLKWKYDLVISQSPPLSMGLVGSWIAGAAGAKSVFIVQDIFPDGLICQGKIKNKILIVFLRMLEKWVYCSNQVVSVISEGFADILKSRIFRRTILKIIPNFVNTDIYQPLPRNNDYSRDYGLDNKFVISYTGNIGNAQDFTGVFAAARACADLPISFLIIGDGIRRRELEVSAKREGLSNLQFWGYQPREATPWINASSDLTLVLLAPHVGSCGFPSKVYTLMASARPILLVGNPDSDIAKLVISTGAGWVVPCSDNDRFIEIIRKLYKERDMLTIFGERGKQAAQEQFTMKHVVRKYHELIMELTSPKR